MSETLTRSEVLDDLLQLVDLDPGAVPGNQAPPGVTAPGTGDRAERNAIEQRYDREYSTTPLYATAEQSKALAAKRFTLGSLLGRFDSDLTHIRAAFDDLAAEFVRVHNESNREGVLRGKLKTDIETAGDGDAIVDGATDTELAPLKPERGRLLKELAPTEGATKTETLKTLTEAAQTYLTAVTELHQEVTSRKEARIKLTGELNQVIAEGATKPEQIVPGSAESDVTGLVTERGLIATAIADPNAKSTDLSLLSTRIGALQLAKGGVADQVAARLQRKQEMQQAAAAAIQGLHEEADDTDANAKKEQLELLLKTTPLDKDTMVKAEKALEAVEYDCQSENEITQERITLRKALKARAAETRELLVSCKGFDVETQTSALDKIDEALDDTLYEIDFDGIETDLSELMGGLDDALGEQIDSASSDSEDEQPASTPKKKAPVKKGSQAKKKGGRTEKAPVEKTNPLPTEYITKSVAAFQAEGTRLTPFAGRFGSELAGLSDQAEAIETLLEDPSAETVKEALGILAKMRSTLDEVRKEAGSELLKCADLHAGLTERLEPENPKDLPPKLATTLNARRTAVTDIIGDELDDTITPEILKDGAKLVDKFEADLAIAKDVALAWAAIQKRFTAIHGAAREPVKAELTARRSAIEDATDIALAKTQCDALTKWLDRSQQEASKGATAKDTLGKVKVGDVELDTPTVELVYDVVGPDALTGLKPKELETLGAAFKKANEGQKKALRALVTEGFGAEGKVLTSLLRSGDADSLLTLATAFGGDTAKDDRTKLRGLVERGGLAEAPTVLDDMLSYGVGATQEGQKQDRRDKNVTVLKDFVGKFGDKDGPARAKTLVADCGLGRPRPGDPPKPGVLAEMMNGEGGFGGDATKLRGLADAYAGNTPTAVTDRKRLDGLMNEGGFAERPKAFAPLIGRLSGGGMGPAATKLKEIGQTFEPAQDRARLKQVLNAGGMSGDAGAPGHDHEHPDTLAQVFTDGLKNDAGKLKQFTDAFGDTGPHAAQCKSMLTSFNEYPDTKKSSRKPGDKIARLLDARHLNGNVSKLQTQFTTNLEQIGDPTLKKQAYRMGPHFEKSQNWYWGGQTQAMADADVDRRAISLKKRHKPETFDFSEANLTSAGFHSQFPPGTDVGALIDLALAEAWPNGGADGKTKVNVGNPALLVEIAVADGKVCHFTPHAVDPDEDDPALVDSPAPPDPQETPKFNTAAMRRIKAGCF